MRKTNEERRRPSLIQIYPYFSTKEIQKSPNPRIRRSQLPPLSPSESLACTGAGVNRRPVKCPSHWHPRINSYQNSSITPSLSSPFLLFSFYLSIRLFLSLSVCPLICLLIWLLFLCIS